MRTPNIKSLNQEQVKALSLKLIKEGEYSRASALVKRFDKLNKSRSQR